MHLYNACLPPPVAQDTIKERESFARIVKSVRESWRSDDPDSVYSTLKWISVLELFIRAKSDISLEDIEALVESGLHLFHTSQNKLYVQVSWGNILVRFLKKYGKKLSLKVQWRPLYETLMHTHFTRNTGPEGWKLRQRHFEATTSLVQACRKFFPAGSACEIWSEFRLLLQNPWHNSSFEGSGFLRLFLPINVDNQDFFSQDWIKQCLDLWNSTPNCPFWDIQWAGIFARLIKNINAFDWECFLPVLFTQYLNMFEVPIANGRGSYPYTIDVPRNTRFLFSGKVVTPASAIAKAIVYLLRPGSSALQYFENMANLLEQYYHPSNGGRWTYSLERLLRYLVINFQKRLRCEVQNVADFSKEELYLGKQERASFVKVVLKLIDRGQYSKNESLAESVAIATSILAYVEPSLVLPFVASRFHLALETMTATHQLKVAVTSVAYAGRALFLASFSSDHCTMGDLGDSEALTNVVLISLKNALLGMDANDPPKTLATIQLIGSIFTNLASIDTDGSGPAFIADDSFSEWLDEFLCRLFSLLLHLEPSNVINEGIHTSATSGTFLVDDGPYYFCMLEILLSKLSKPLYKQALKKISKFVNTNILPGAIAEIGLLCCACVHSNPVEALVQLVEPMVKAATSSLKGIPISGFGGKGFSDGVFSLKSTISPALETAIDFQLKVLSVAINYAGPALLRYRNELTVAIANAFEAPSWKVNGAADLLLRSVLCSLVLYYPVDQYRFFSHHPCASMLEEWFSTKDYQQGGQPLNPKWHIPTKDELAFANELLDLHLRSALDDLLRICQSKIHSDLGNEKEHLKVTLLRIHASLQGVLSCLPDFPPSFRNGNASNEDYISSIVAGASGAIVGSSELREKAAEVIHATCKYLLEERSDESIVLILIIRIIDALVNFGGAEFDEWSNHRQAWKLESATILEPPVNFITSFHSKGKRRPRWALIDKVFMHHTWRSSQSSYHFYRINGKLYPSEHVIALVDDILELSIHCYETVRTLAGKSLLKILKRFPALIGRCVLKLTESLLLPNTAEHAVLGSCMVLATSSVLRRLSMDWKAFSSFIRSILASSHHESLKAQKAINELFVKFNIYFAGVSKTVLKTSSEYQPDKQDFAHLVSEILSFDSSDLHWRYNLMSYRILLLLTMATRSDEDLSSKMLVETSGLFLKQLNSQIPQTRMLSISALNILLKESRHKVSINVDDNYDENITACPGPSLEEELNKVFQEEGFFLRTLSSLSHVHIIGDAENLSSRGNHGAVSIQSMTDKSVTLFYFDFSASWPRTPSWISLLRGDTFYPSFARVFKRLGQECGMTLVTGLKDIVMEFSDAKERSKQCVAAEAFAGLLHSDINGISDAWDSWMIIQLQRIILAPSVDSIPEWAACIRYAVTGKGKYGTKVPLLRHKILYSLLEPLPHLAPTNVVAKRYTFLSAALIEISPSKMSEAEMQFHYKLLQELLDNMNHSSAQVREAVGITLSIVCSNMRLLTSSAMGKSCEETIANLKKSFKVDSWDHFLVQRASNLVSSIQNANQSGNLESSTDLIHGDGSLEDNVPGDVQWMETILHFLISCLKSGRSSYLLDVVVGLLYPVISLQETSHKDLSTLAKAAFELLRWKIIPHPHVQKALSVLLSLTNDANWRVRSATLTYFRTFLYRHTFILTSLEKHQIWQNICNLLVDNQVEVREHAARVLAGLLKGADENIAENFRDRAYAEAYSIKRKQKRRDLNSGHLISATHGAVLALAASVLSVPYDMPSWLPKHVTLLAQFIGEPSPIRSTVTKAVAEFRRTHADTWNIQKDSFTVDELEVLADTTSSSSYFA